MGVMYVRRMPESGVRLGLPPSLYSLSWPDVHLSQPFILTDLICCYCVVVSGEFNSNSSDRLPLFLTLFQIHTENRGIITCSLAALHLLKPGGHKSAHAHVCLACTEPRWSGP